MHSELFYACDGDLLLRTVLGSKGIMAIYVNPSLRE